MKNFVLFSAAVGMVMFAPHEAFATTITFTGAAITVDTPSVSESGFTFTRDSSIGGSMGISAAGGVFLTGNFLRFNQPATVTLTGPPAFNLMHIDFSSFSIPSNLSVLGNLVGGGTLSESLTTAGPGTDPFNFVNWTNLASVVFSSTSSGAIIGLDNIDVSAFSPPAAVPEPATASILGLGTLVGAFCQYRRRRREVAN